MTGLLTLRTDADDRLTPLLGGETFAPPTPLGSLPALARLQADPFNLGQHLMAALGGTALLARLDHRHRGLWPGCYQPGQRAGCSAAHRQITMASASPADASQQTIYAHT